MSMGTCKFNVGGFDGGVSLVATDFELVNATENYSTKYYIYRTD
jgi:hypothetical protein